MPLHFHHKAYITEMDAVLKCSDCDKEVVYGECNFPSVRSLSWLKEAFEAIRTLIGQSSHSGPSQCSHCKGNLTLEYLQYRWDETDLPPIRYNPSSGLRLDQETVNTEHQIFDCIGRPFSLAHYHQHELNLPGEVYLYPTAPGLITCGFKGHISTERQQSLRDQASAILYPSGDELPEEGVINWQQIIKAGPLTWLGSRALDIEEGSVVVESVVDLNYLRDCLTAALDTRNFHWKSQDNHTFIVKRGDLALSLELSIIALKALALPSSLAEAVHLLLEEIERLFASIERALKLLGPIGHALVWKPDLQASLQTSSGEYRTLGIGAIAARLECQPQEIAEKLHMVITAITKEGQCALERPRPCGCLPVLTVVARSNEWVERSNNNSSRLMTEAITEEVQACLVEDCQHYGRFLREGSLEKKEGFRRASQQIASAELTGHLRRILTIEGEVCGGICVGQSFSSVAWTPNLIRSLADEVGLSGVECQIIIPSTDIVCLASPEADPGLITLSLSQAIGDLPHDTREAMLPLAIDYEIGLVGGREGCFTLQSF